MYKQAMLPVVYVLQNELYSIPVNEIPTYFTMIFLKFSYSMLVQADGTSKIITQYVPMPVVPCASLFSNATAIKPYEPYLETAFFKAHARNYGMCVKANEAGTIVSGGGSAQSLEVLSLMIMPCLLPQGCAPPSVIKNAGLLISMPSSSLNLSNYEEPVKTYLPSETYYFVNEAVR